MTERTVIGLNANRFAFLFLVAVCFLGTGLNGGEPVFSKIVDGQTQIVEGFKDPELWLRHDLWVETEFDSDGDGKLDRMHVAVTRPRQTDTESLKVPVVYVTSPYFAGTAGPGREFFWNVNQELAMNSPERKPAPPITPHGIRPIISKSHTETWVPHGYAVVHSSSPGTGLSQGCPTIGGDNESLAPKAVIDWLTGRGKGFTTPDGWEPVIADWSTGKVGMTGTSFNGTLALAAATTGVEGLEAIIPIAPNTSYYHYYRSNGLVRSPFGYLGEDIDVLYEYVHSRESDRHEYCDCNVRDLEMKNDIDRQTGDYNDFWKGRDYVHDLNPLRAATFIAHAFNDWNVMPEHSVRIYEALKETDVPLKAYFHQGGHGGPPPMEMMNRWFTRYLHGIENGVEKEKPVWIVRENAEASKPTAYAAYPHPNAKLVKIHLSPGAPRQGQLTIDQMEEPGTESLVDNVSFDGETLARAEWTNHRLIYVTPKLTKPIHLSGTAKITIRLASSKPAANLSVWLVSLPWNNRRDAKITENIITRGWADPQNADSLTLSKPLVPGEFYDLEFDFQPDDQIIPKEQQIGLMIFSSDRDVTLHPQPGTQLTVDLNQTFLELPIVGGIGKLSASISKSQSN